MGNCVLFSFPLITITSLLMVASASAQRQEINGRIFNNSNRLFHNDKSGLVQSAISSEDTLKKFPLIKPDFMVNALAGEYGAEQTSPNIAIDSSGTYAITWNDSRNGKKEIFIQFFDRQNNRLGQNILVSEEANDWNSDPAIGTSRRGNFIVTWAQEHDQILAQQFSKEGLKLGGNFPVNSLYGLNTMEPSIAVNDSGYFLVTWAQDIDGGWDWNTYARLFDPTGAPLGPEIIVNDVYGQGASSLGWGNCVAVDKQGNFAVVWSEYENQRSRIFLQKINQYGQKVGTNVIISAPNDSSNHYFPSVTANSDGHFLIVWENSGVLARIFHMDGYFVSDQITVYDSNSSWNPCSASSDGRDLFFIHWSGGTPLMCQKLTSSGVLLGSPVTLSTVSSNTVFAMSSKISNVVDSCFKLCYMSYSNFDLDIWLQKYDVNYTPIDPEVKVNDDLLSSWQINPLVYFNKYGNPIILWEDHRNGLADLFAQVYDASFQPVGENLQINDVQLEHWRTGSKAVSELSDGTFISAFTVAGPSYGDNIYFQRINQQGQNVGPNRLIKETYQTYDIVLKTNELDEVMVCWCTREYSTNAVYFRKYNKNLSAISSEKEIIFYQPGYRHYPFAISINDSFELLLTWCSENTETHDYDGKVYGQFYDDTAAPISALLTVGTYDHSGRIYSIDNWSIDTENYVVAWLDSWGVNVERHYLKGDTVSFKYLFHYYSSNHFGPQIINFENHKCFITWTLDNSVYGYFFNDNERKVQGYKIHEFEPLSSYWNDYYTSNSISIFNRLLLLSYESNIQAGTGFDIWANVQKTDEINFEKEIYLPPANDDVLYQNCPNPFNSGTTIVYELFAFHKVKLTVYDILGREVQVLVDQYQEKGFYQVNFNSSSLPSGVYFCRLEAFRTQVIKMLLIN